MYRTPSQWGVLYIPDMREPTSTVKVFTSDLSKTGGKYGTIGMCVRDHVAAQTFMSALTNDWRFLAGDSCKWLTVQGSMLVLQRNECLKQMEGEWILFIDDDMVWNPQAIGQLVKSWEEVQEQFDEPVIMGGLCHRREAPYDATMYMRDDAKTGKYRFMETWDSDIVEVDATGLAFVLIPVKALEAIMDTPWPNFETRQLYQSPPIFQWTQHLGEDLRFMQDAKAAGCRIFVDTRVRIGHVTEVVVDRSSFLQHIKERSQDDEDMVREINEKHGLPTLSSEDAEHELKTGSMGRDAKDVKKKDREWKTAGEATTPSIS